MKRKTYPLLLLVPLLSACSVLGYYGQSIQGQRDLLARREPMASLIAASGTEEGLRRRLHRVLEMRDFASRELALPDNGSYRSYADLERPALIWSVVATPEFSMTPRQWCYPVVGCASYRGYFDREAADAFAGNLRREGLDVVVEPVPAYSTLGWFDDPLPSTVVHWPEHRLAGLIFHELAHQKLYFPGDSAFNEAFANTVQQTGVDRWLKKRSVPELIVRQRKEKAREKAFVALLMAARADLATLFEGPLAEEEKRLAKRERFHQLRREYRALKREKWNGYSGYDLWFDRELNNARLASIATYEDLVPALLGLLRKENGDLSAFYRACAELEAFSPDERREYLRSVALPCHGCEE